MHGGHFIKAWAQDLWAERAAAPCCHLLPPAAGVTMSRGFCTLGVREVKTREVQKGLCLLRKTQDTGALALSSQGGSPYNKGASWRSGIACLPQGFASGLQVRKNS